jgi:hypothetical protein
VAAAQILDERVSGGQYPRGPVVLQSAHRPQPGFQSAVVGLDRIVRVPLYGMQRRGDQLVQDPRISRGPVGGDLGRDRTRAQRPDEEPPGGSQVPPHGQHDVDDLAVLVNRPVQVRPTARHLDIGFVGKPPGARRQNRARQRTATAITSRGNRKPANTEVEPEDITPPVSRSLRSANATLPVIGTDVCG